MAANYHDRIQEGDWPANADKPWLDCEELPDLLKLVVDCELVALRVAVPVAVRIRVHVHEEVLEDVLDGPLHLDDVRNCQSNRICKLLFKVEDHSEGILFYFLLYDVQVVFL